jgi:hypothetical protein
MGGEVGRVSERAGAAGEQQPTDAGSGRPQAIVSGVCRANLDEICYITKGR